jgi:hypothetical protein
MSRVHSKTLHLVSSHYSSRYDRVFMSGMNVKAKGNKGIMKATTNRAIEYSFKTSSGNIPIAKYDTVSQKDVNIKSANKFW